MSPLRSDTQVLVLGLYIQGAAVLRHLSSLGYRVAGLTDFAGDSGLRSRHGEKRLVPHCLERHEEWVETLLALVADCKEPPAVLPTIDRCVLGLDRAAERLRPAMRFHGLGSGLRSRLTGKAATFALAQECGFPAPATETVGDAEAILAFCRDRAWPALVKPDLSHQWHKKEATDRLNISGQKVLTAETPERLVELFEALRPHSPFAVIQEVIPGPDENLIYWAGFVGDDGRVRGRIVGRKLRTTPPHFGSASFVQLADLPEVEAQCEDFLKKLGYRGIAGIEMKIDSRDGQAKLIEVNPRCSLWDEIGVPVGVDLAREAVDALFGKDTEPHRATRFDQKWLHLGRDLRALRQYRADGGLKFGDWLQSIAGHTLVSDLPILSDAPYALGSLREIGGAFRRHLLEP